MMRWHLLPLIAPFALACGNGPEAVETSGAGGAEPLAELQQEGATRSAGRFPGRGSLGSRRWWAAPTLRILIRPMPGKPLLQSDYRRADDLAAWPAAAESRHLNLGDH